MKWEPVEIAAVIKRGLYRRAKEEQDLESVMVSVDLGDQSQEGQQPTDRTGDQMSDEAHAAEEQPESATVDTDPSEAQEIFLRRLLQSKDLDEAEGKLRDRFRRQAKEFAELCSPRCPQRFNEELAELRSGGNTIERVGNEGAAHRRKTEGRC